MVTTRKRSTNTMNLFKKSAASPQSTFGRDTILAGVVSIALGGIAIAGAGLF